MCSWSFPLYSLRRCVKTGSEGKRIGFWNYTPPKEHSQAESTRSSPGGDGLMKCDSSRLAPIKTCEAISFPAGNGKNMIYLILYLSYFRTACLDLSVFVQHSVTQHLFVSELNSCGACPGCSDGGVRVFGLRRALAGVGRPWPKEKEGAFTCSRTFQQVAFGMFLGHP